jgi:polyvinyl alcohol dehydrogenase (cytochrome)
VRTVRLSLVVLVALLLLPGAASAAWTTFHGDRARSGVDSSSSGSVPFASAWTSPNLDGPVYAEPLVYDGLVLIATERNSLYGLSESTGQVVWHANAGAAVPASALPCGDISPTVGITSTPVIDTASGTLFALGDLWDGSHAHHWLIAYQAATGKELWRETVDPAGSIPENQLQRAALNLAGGRVVLGFGGNDGDCGTYWGWLVSVSESTHAISTWQAASADTEAAIWATGGAAVDSAGYVYAATGNGASGSSYDYGDSLLKFTSGANLVSYFRSPTWAADNTADLDLGSASPELLPGGLVYQDGKNGNGYLVATATMGELYEAPVCNSFGADATQNNIIYVACIGGIRALQLNTVTHRFSQLWHGPSAANGPPIIAGGLVWVANWDGTTLYGLNPHTGQAVVTKSTPPMEHFTTPSASDGKLFLATGHTVEAYSIAHAVSPPVSPPPAPTTQSGCGRITVRLKVPRHTRVRRASVYRAGKRLASRHGRRLHRISFRSPAHVRSFTIRLVEITTPRHRLSFRVKFRSCRRVIARHR